MNPLFDSVDSGDFYSNVRTLAQKQRTILSLKTLIYCKQFKKIQKMQQEIQNAHKNKSIGTRLLTIFGVLSGSCSLAYFFCSKKNRDKSLLFLVISVTSIAGAIFNFVYFKKKSQRLQYSLARSFRLDRLFLAIAKFNIERAL